MRKLVLFMVISFVTLGLTLSSGTASIVLMIIGVVSFYQTPSS
nr:hypothetical protein P5664_00005 [Bacillus subtilis]